VSETKIVVPSGTSSVDVEVPAKAKRRIFTAEEKKRNARFSRWGSEANRLLKTLQSSRVEFIDLRPAFEDHDGLIRPELTSDGLHLSAQGYWLWAAAIRGFI
jgi:lysophospholipase L1-like esterase